MRNIKVSLSDIKTIFQFKILQLQAAIQGINFFHSKTFHISKILKEKRSYRFSIYFFLHLGFNFWEIYITTYML
jgi:hypothetical protein